MASKSPPVTGTSRIEDLRPATMSTWCLQRAISRCGANIGIAAEIAPAGSPTAARGYCCRRRGRPTAPSPALGKRHHRALAHAVLWPDWWAEFGAPTRSEPSLQDWHSSSADHDTPPRPSATSAMASLISTQTAPLRSSTARRSCKRWIHSAAPVRRDEKERVQSATELLSLAVPRLMAEPASLGR
jgi:hypothetical protein